jgi:alpha-galactosidase
MIFSLSNHAPFEGAADWARLSNAWRTTGDIRDTWQSVGGIGFSQDRWAQFAGPGHWNDPDMLVVGMVGWGTPHATKLTADEQYTHICLWCLLSAPLLLGADLEKLDEFTLSLLSNDEVLAVDQDSLGKQATRVAGEGDLGVWAKELEDGSRAVGLFNRSEKETDISAPFSAIGISGKQIARDLWRQKDLGEFEGEFKAKVASHGVVFVRLRSAGK